MLNIFISYTLYVFVVHRYNKYVNILFYYITCNNMILNLFLKGAG